MRLFTVSIAASLLAATPALANEARVEARGGIIWDSNATEEIAGIAAGYDYDLGTTAFVGAEVTADKLLTSGTQVSFGFNGRVGANLSEAGKLYAVGGYNTETCNGCEGSWTLGAGYQHSFGKLYGKVEYRHFFNDNPLFNDTDGAVIGLGVKF